MTHTAVRVENPLTHDLVMERVRALLPAIRDRAEQTERDRTIPPESAKEFLDAGLAQILVPKKFGGAELGLKTWMDVVQTIATADGGHGWYASLLIHTPHYLAQFPEPAQRAVWADGPDVAMAGSLTPASRIEHVDGGYRISGKIGYLSGVNYSSWILVGGMLPGEDDQPDWTIFVVPPGHFNVEDTWHTIGMRGSGSNTVVYEDVFVPSDHVLRVADMRDATSPGGQLHESNYFRSPWITYAPATFVGPMLGAARGALEDYRAWTAERTSLFGSPVARFTSIQVRLARAAASLDAAELLVYRALDVAEDDVMASFELRARTYRDQCYAAELILSAMDTIMQISGSQGFAEGNSIQRAWRDVHFASTHVILNPETSFAAYGRQQFGLERDPQQGMY